MSPNKLHHLFLADWKSAFPTARLYAPPGLRKKRPDLPFDHDLGDAAAPAWNGVLQQKVIPGSFFMAEVLFLHRPSRTLLVGDLIENHDPARFARWQRVVGRANAMLAPHGTTPRNYRLTFWRRREARRALREVLLWDPKRVVVTHGPVVDEDAREFLQNAFRWVL